MATTWAGGKQSTAESIFSTELTLPAYLTTDSSSWSWLTHPIGVPTAVIATKVSQGVAHIPLGAVGDAAALSGTLITMITTSSPPTFSSTSPTESQGPSPDTGTPGHVLSDEKAAGLAIGCLVLGLLLGSSLSFCFLKSHRRTLDGPAVRRASSAVVPLPRPIDYDEGGDEDFAAGAGTHLKRLVPAPVRGGPDSSAGGLVPREAKRLLGAALERLLPIGVADNVLRRRLAQLDQRIQRHVRTHYHVLALGKDAPSMSGTSAGTGSGPEMGAAAKQRTTHHDKELADQLVSSGLLDVGPSAPLLAGRVARLCAHPTSRQRGIRALVAYAVFASFAGAARPSESWPRSGAAHRQGRRFSFLPAVVEDFMAAMPVGHEEEESGGGWNSGKFYLSLPPFSLILFNPLMPVPRGLGRDDYSGTGGQNKAPET